MTVFVYVDTSRQVGDVDHVKVFPMPTPRKPGSRKTIPKAWPLSMRSGMKETATGSLTVGLLRRSCSQESAKPRQPFVALSCVFQYFARPAPVFRRPSLGIGRR